MEIVGTSVKKSTKEDKERIKEIMGEDAHMIDDMKPREMYKMLKDARADIMLSGGRSQFVALKAKMPWLDINQERHYAYAGYDGMVALVREIDKTLSNPVWAQVRAPAPWDEVSWEERADEANAADAGLPPKAPRPRPERPSGASASASARRSTRPRSRTPSAPTSSCASTMCARTPRPAAAAEPARRDRQDPDTHQWRGIPAFEQTPAPVAAKTIPTHGRREDGMAKVQLSKKACTVNPLKMSQPLGGALAFLGVKSCMPLLHGSQGCTSFGLVLFVRHFREAIPMQTTAMSEVATVLGGYENVEQAVVTIASRANPAIIGICSTGVTEIKGDDVDGFMKLIRQSHPELDASEARLRVDAGFRRAPSRTAGRRP